MTVFRWCFQFSMFNKKIILLKTVTDNLNDASKNSRPKTEKASKMKELIAISVNDVVFTRENGKKLFYIQLELSITVSYYTKKKTKMLYNIL